MTLKRYGKKELYCVTTENKKVLYSYKTPVVVLENGEYFVTNQFHSQTTSKHINYFLSEEAKGAGPYSAFNTIKISQFEINKKAN